jgi:hypothetical protein
LRECFSSRITRQTPVVTASDIGLASNVVSVEACVDKVVIGASDASQTLYSVRRLCDISSSFEPSCAPDAVASVDPSSDVSGERKSSLDAYWSASDAGRRTLSARRRTRPVLTETTIEL